MDPFADDYDNLDPIAQIQSWAEPVMDPTSPVELPITLSLSPRQRVLAAIIVVLSVAGVWGALHYVPTESWDPVVGIVLGLIVLGGGISLLVSSITLDDAEYTEIGGWRIETVPLSSVVQVRHHEDMVALVTNAGVVKFIGPLGNAGGKTLSHGLPEGATAAGVAAAIERARRSALGRPPHASRHRVPPGYLWAAAAAVVLLIRVLTLFIL